jgi:hypothetical protein
LRSKMFAVCSLRSCLPTIKLMFIVECRLSLRAGGSIQTDYVLLACEWLKAQYMAKLANLLNRSQLEILNEAMFPMRLSSIWIRKSILGPCLGLL